MGKRRFKKDRSLCSKGIGAHNPIPDRVAEAFSIAYGETDPERGREKLFELLDEAQTEEERQALLGYGEVLQMRLMAGKGRES